jgi:RimJ/RimL family protein N-acetyltransferase
MKRAQRFNVLLYGHDAALIAWTEKQLGATIKVCQPTAIGVARNGRIVAAALFSNYQPPNIEITFVTTTPLWASKENVKAILSYPFKQLGCKRITAITEEVNTAARAFMERLGFVHEGTHPDAFPSGAGISYGLSAARAERWIK